MICRLLTVPVLSFAVGSSDPSLSGDERQIFLGGGGQ